jgi:uncharacterized protein (DUF433 family)
MCRAGILNFPFDKYAYVLYIVYPLTKITINTMSYKEIITIEPGKRGGKPCIRGMRITVYEVLSYLASGMSYEEILDDFPYLTKKDILASLEYAADREHYMLATPE